MSLTDHVHATFRIVEDPQRDDLRRQIISVVLRVVASNTQQNDETVSDLADNLTIDRDTGTASPVALPARIYLSCAKQTGGKSIRTSSLWRTAGSNLNTARQRAIGIRKQIHYYLRERHPG